MNVCMWVVGVCGAIYYRSAVKMPVFTFAATGGGVAAGKKRQSDRRPKAENDYRVPTDRRTGRVECTHIVSVAAATAAAAAAGALCRSSEHV